MDAGTVRSWLAASAVAIREQRDYLTQLDAAIGDADHGANMDRGFTAVVERLDGEAPSEPPGKLLLTAGSTLVSTVGGASGPLWGTALRRAGRVLGEAEAFGPEELVAALDAALAGVVDLGAASEGEKTMVDAFGPGVDVLKEAQASGEDFTTALRRSVAAVEAGMQATIPMLATKGRASYLGERSIGHQDPGATSVFYIAQVLLETIESIQE